MTITFAEYAVEAKRAERIFDEAFRKKSLDGLEEKFLACYASVLESHERRFTIGMCGYPFTLTRQARRCPGFFKCEDSFQAKLSLSLPSAAKHEFHYLNSSGVWRAMATTAKQKSDVENRVGLAHARFSGLAWSLKRVGDQIQLARYDYFSQVVESGVSVAKSLAEAFEATNMGVYSDEFSSGLSTIQSDFRRFLASETAKQQAKSNVHGSSAGGRE